MVVDYSAIRAAVGLAEEAKIPFWDALIVVSAVRPGAAVLYTKDLNDGQEILGVRISNPLRCDGRRLETPRHLTKRKPGRGGSIGDRYPPSPYGL